jgi:hypothetical protein
MKRDIIRIEGRKPMVRCKFWCNENAKMEGEGFRITFHAVTNGNEENRRFFKYTPTGLLQFQTINEEAAKQIIEGKSYYVDISEAD